MAQSLRKAFTLVELLVVIGIIALLISILLPALNRARESANTIKCATNLRTIGQGIGIYLSENKQTYPAAYIYSGMTISGGVQTPDSPIDGYVHWSSYLYKNFKVGASREAIFGNSTGWQAFTCPSIEQGGLAPTNTVVDNRDAGMVSDAPAGIIDLQAPRCAFTVNEAIMPRNKFVTRFQGTNTPYVFVKVLKNSAGTILATEWNQDWRFAGADGYKTGDVVCKSHRPVHGFYTDSVGLDVFKLSPDPFGRSTPLHRVAPDGASTHAPAADPEPGTGVTLLDQVGRNHGSNTLKKSGGKNMKTSNFLYCDGHVDTKSVFETLKPFQWGERFYSLGSAGTPSAN